MVIIELSCITFNTKCVCQGRKRRDFAGHTYNYEWLYIHYCSSYVRRGNVPRHMNMQEYLCKTCGNPCQRL